jgi:aspartate-semialdehyde dehydrogenase
VSIKLGNKLGRPVTREDILAAWSEFKPLKLMHLPMAPEQPVEFVPQQDRPQPRLDRNRGRGMAVTAGRLRPCNVLDWKFTVLSHNTIRGAAGAAILNAELLRDLGKLDPEPPPDKSGSLEIKKTTKTIETVGGVIEGVLSVGGNLILS